MASSASTWGCSDQDYHRHEIQMMPSLNLQVLLHAQQFLIHRGRAFPSNASCQFCRPFLSSFSLRSSRRYRLATSTFTEVELASMATIRIADPVKPERPIDERRGRESVGGIYNTRGISIDGRRSKSRLRRFSVDTRSGDCEEGEDEDPGLRQAGDFKEKQVCIAFMNLRMARILK